MSNREVTLGIDFGTTHSTLSICYPKGNIETVRVDGESVLLKSFVKYNNNKITVGEAANDINAIVNGNVIFNVKRLIGRKFVDVRDSGVKDMCGAKVVEGPGGYAVFDIPSIGRTVSPVEVASAIFKHLYEMAFTATNGYDIARAVITYPVSYTQDQIAATQEAARQVIQGIPLLFIKETTAATCAYRELDGYNGNREETILVYDLGGGTFDVALVNIHNQEVKVLKTDGLLTVGGEKFDDAILKWVLDRYQQQMEEELMPDQDGDEALHYRLLSKLREECQKAKENLCNTECETIVDLKLFMNLFREFNHCYNGNDDDDAIDDCYDDYLLSMPQLDGLISGFVDQTLNLVESILHQKNLTPDAISKVLLVGGSTRIPIVRRKLNRVFGGKLCLEMDPNICVSYGAASYGMKRDLIEIAYIEGTKFDYFTLKVRNGRRIRKLIIPKGHLYGIPVEKRFGIPPEYCGCFNDRIYEGDISNPRASIELAYIESNNVTRVTDRKVYVKYIFTFNNGLLYYTLIDEESGRTLIRNEVMSSLARYSVCHYTLSWKI